MPQTRGLSNHDIENYLKEEDVAAHEDLSDGDIVASAIEKKETNSDREAEESKLCVTTNECENWLCFFRNNFAQNDSAYDIFKVEELANKVSIISQVKAHQTTMPAYFKLEKE